MDRIQDDKCRDNKVRPGGANLATVLRLQRHCILVAHYFREIHVSSLPPATTNKCLNKLCSYQGITCASAYNAGGMSRFFTAPGLSISSLLNALSFHLATVSKKPMTIHCTPHLSFYRIITFRTQHYLANHTTRVGLLKVITHTSTSPRRLLNSHTYMQTYEDM